MRADWREQLREVQRDIGFEYIRFHGILNDEMMIYREREGKPVYTWHYLDSLFDFLLSVNLRPLLELSFMPSALASGTETAFWWRGNITPPKDYARWAALVEAIIRHCIDRYGLEEVLRWRFEVWNEPNLHGVFWSGTDEDYFRLYAVTAEAVKRIDPRLCVGGPAAAGSCGENGRLTDNFLAHCAAENLPVDFISTHPYPVDGQMRFRDMNSTHDDLRALRELVDASAFPHAEILLDEWNSSWTPRDPAHDTAFMAPFIVQNNLRCLGLVDALAFWTFTDVFEEDGSGETLFHGGFGMMTLQGIRKPSFYGYWFLSRLGNHLLAQGENYVVTCRGENRQILLWNYAHYHEAYATGEQRYHQGITPDEVYDMFEDKEGETFLIHLGCLTGDYKVTTYRLDRDHGSAVDSWLRMGAPPTPTAEEIDYLRAQSRPHMHVRWIDVSAQNALEIQVLAHGVTLITLEPQIMLNTAY
jgi:xylan 1,4-beta-xylosidase